ncbi:epithelial cell-transforming sequence 2 oncogene-like isoform X2 [Cynoglossus semilaevis]|uniref:epithelial cell-transforming sequence 2 oncogene-like isoform X2 n=1 Tax=Cynoglossus semilaevis TaxID=244447 RepID=UPI000D62EB9E|nr:epithelial cell-transforming sequence 2 oncogene-like isoform X2 [Cynoglossus semilaevis]
MEERKLKRKSPRNSTSTVPPTGGSGRKNSGTTGGRQVGYNSNMGTQSSQKSKSRKGGRDKPRYQAGSGGKTSQNQNQNQGQAAPVIQHSFLTDVSDVQEMEKGLLSLLNDFHSGKLQAFALPVLSGPGNECSIGQMEHVREMQEKLAQLHFDLYGDVNEIACDTNMEKLLLNLEELSSSMYPSDILPFTCSQDMDLTPTPHSVKRWQLRGTDYEPPRPASRTVFSSWTPLNNKQSNLQLFEERTTLVLHWFHLWTDKQRKHLLLSLLQCCTKSQLKYCRDILIETVPVTKVDFTSVLPRFLSLYVMSFLSPRDLCAAAQVSWHWMFLAEQDCIWASRCIRRGWFLPYAPREKEYGAWKNHYVSCMSTLDWLTPREAAQQYGHLIQQSMKLTEEEEERKDGRRFRQMLRDKLHEEKGLILRTRRAWGSYNKGGGGSTKTLRPNSAMSLMSSWPSLSRLSLDEGQVTSSAQSIQASVSISGGVNKACGALTSFVCSPQMSQTVHHTSPVLLLMISNRIPAYELLLSGVKAEVMVVLYDHRGTLKDLVTQVERATCGQSFQRIGVLTPGGTEEVHLLQNSTMSEKTVLNTDHREFWEKLSRWVAGSEDKGWIDIFSPLAASASGVTLIQTLSTLTGLEVCAPMGLATGSFQNILGEWTDSSMFTGQCQDHSASPALQYVWNSVLQSWCTQSRWVEEALEELRVYLGLQLKKISSQGRGRALGNFLWEKIHLEEILVSKQLSEALTEGLTILTAQKETRPLEFLASFLTGWSERKDSEDGTTRAADFSLPLPAPRGNQSDLPLTLLDWRGLITKELHHSEGLYLGKLSAVVKVYLEPLAAALNSNRTILNYADIQIIFNPVTQILELNSVFQEDLQTRLQQWGPQQCVGDVFVKLCSRLRVYTNYLNNYTTALCTIDKCRETKPAFRAFLKRVDRTLTTHMLSLQELLLCPVWRIQEYVTLLQALCLHTLDTHPDHTHLCSALNTLLCYRGFIHKLKRNTEKDRVMEETQQMIQGCPNLSEPNRQLVITQDAALLRSPDEKIPDSLRTFEHVADVGLFLFNDALLLTRRNVHHIPFTVTKRCTHTFLASVALTSLTVREITHTRYVCHAFVLEGPCRSWVCAMEKEEMRDHFLSVLRSTINSALNEHH